MNDSELRKGLLERVLLKRLNKQLEDDAKLPSIERMSYLDRIALKERIEEVSRV